MRPNLLFFIVILLAFNLQCTSNYLPEPSVKKTTSFISQSPISYCGLESFTKSESEHIIREINRPFEVCEIKGQIKNEAGDWPEGTRVLFELCKRGKNSKIEKVHSDKKGLFRIKHVENGIYCFKATVNGWQSVLGIIILSKEADPKSEISFEMLLGI